MLNGNDKLHLDNTLRSCFVGCRRKFYFQHVMNLKTYYGSNALRYGIVWHAGMDAFYNHIKDNGWTRDGAAINAAVSAMKVEWDDYSSKETFYTDYRTLENCIQAFLAYVNHFAQDEMMMKVVSTEEAFKIEMGVDTEEEWNLFKGLENFFFTGKHDMGVLLNDQAWLVEHKTTGQPIDQQCVRLNRSAQCMGYFYSMTRKTGNIPSGVLMVIHHLSARKSTAKGREGEYGNPKIDFRRSPQLFSENDIKQWRLSFLSTAYDIQCEIERNLWPMNHDNCFEYSSCPYLSICEQNSSVDNIWIDDSRFYVGEAWEVAKDVTSKDVVYK